jgi:beta-lactam-binding protein with PASTA domain
MTFFKFLFTKAFLKQLLIAIVALIVLSFLILMWMKSTTNHGQQIEVPNLAKLSLDKVEEVLEENDLRYEVLDSANYNPDYPRYSVIEQIPKAGKFVKEDRKIYLTINPSGYTKLKVPNVVNKTLRQAEPTLLASGFQIGTISKIPHVSDQVQQMRYKGTKLEAGTELQKTSVIDLIVGDGSGNLSRSVDNNQEGSSNDNDNGDN